jgi:hypothetical protein
VWRVAGWRNVMSVPMRSMMSPCLLIVLSYHKKTEMYTAS